jgi:TolB-like protein/DNA-binding winged helix-turn-helix (wHTH) protein/Tfp pilus assembly protein PilF
MTEAASSEIVLNGVVVDFAAGTVRDPSDRRVPLRPQCMDVLRVLVERPDRLVPRDEIMRAVWPDVAVTDDSLVQCIGEIRRAIGDGRHEVLRTVPRRGYLLAAPEPRGGAVRRRWPGPLPVAAVASVVVAATIALAVVWWQRPTTPETAAMPLVAVLPFDALARDETTRLLALGLTEDVITDLARFPEFGVLASNATEAWRDRPSDPRGIGAALGAHFVVVGSIARQGDRVRVTAQLIDGETGSDLWAERWDRPALDVFAVQSEIAETIANRLGGGAGLVQEAGRTAARRKPPENLDAYEAYLLGTERLEGLTRPDVEAAIELLSRAVEIDPGFARAWLELYHAHDALGLFNVERESNRAQAEAAAARALALDPSDAEARVVAAMSLARQGLHARAKAEFDAALGLAPNAAEILTFYSAFASNFGEAARGAEMADRARRLDPNFPDWKAKFYSYAYFVAERYQDSLDMIDRLKPEIYSPRTWAMHAAALAAVGREVEAEEWVAKALEAWPGYSIETVMNFPGPDAAARDHFIRTMRQAGFPACAPTAFLASVPDPIRLPECVTGGSAVAAGDGDPG